MTMFIKEFVWISLWILTVIASTDHISPEGCGRGWYYFNDYCYLVVDAQVHHDSAKAVCIVKGSTLLSLWNPTEITFVIDLLSSTLYGKVDVWVGSAAIRDMWVWVDGSGSLGAVFTETKYPEPSKDVCGFLTPSGSLDFADCDLIKPAFICKRPLDMVYVPSSVNITQTGIQLPARIYDDEVLFERLWPPFLDRIVLNVTSPNYIATVEVAHEADCAYRCYSVDECQAFSVVCKSARKCNMRFCSLLAGLDVTNLLPSM